ncbi:Ribosomal protein L11 methyltransferase [Rhynchospora pubera]|uniref:ETFB lysine methyltransferase n=1 Tax=Rhynchospora pubera TaxID=906938 RepID=A0AAV8CFC3_9POAL|nr:Ribosomal protein L11 methyltransferase [Rhynchospora pubera]
MTASLHGRLSLLKHLIPFKSHHSSLLSPLHTTYSTSLPPDSPPQILIPPVSTLSRFKTKPSFARSVQLNGVSAFTSESDTSSITDVASDYLSVNIRCQKQDAEALSEALLSFGACSAYMDDLSDFGDLDEISITSIFPQDARVGTCITEAASSICLEYSPSYDISVCRQCDWASYVQESFQPTKVIDGLWVVPTWTEPPDLQSTNIILDPGLAFGTGEHPTTKLCLLLLYKLIKGGEHVLDYGTGSGVLGIAALKMGAALSVGLDIDPHAVTSARHNASLNSINPSRMPLYLVSGKSGLASPDATVDDLVSRKGQFDIIIANILLNPLMELADDIVSYGKPGSIIGLSGILSEQVPQLEERYSKYLDGISLSEMNGWACLRGIKKMH